MSCTLPAAGLTQQEAMNQQIIEQYMKNMQDLIHAQQNIKAQNNPDAQMQAPAAPMLPPVQNGTPAAPRPQAPSVPAPAPVNGSMAMQSQMPETLTNPAFTAGYLRTQIGKLMRVEFLIGNSITDRVGRLAEVGASFIILQSLETNTRYMCDLFAIKFVNIIDGMTAYPELAML